jgi:TPP-dependent pyruvate/acetoin dehydrogenase alpha subunit
MEQFEHKEYLGWTKEKLLAFSEDIAKINSTGVIKSPIHLGGGCEDYLIELFSEAKITKEDWVLSTWRSHWHWLLSGRSEEELRKQILEGHSMHIYDDRFITSAIVGGVSPIAVGLGWALKEKGSKDRVFVFCGDGAYACGITQESIRFCSGHDLPVYFIHENNFLGVNAVTEDSWGRNRSEKVIKYNYERLYHHAGGNKMKDKKDYVMF